MGFVFLAVVSSNAAEKLIFSMDFEDQVSGLASANPGWQSLDGKVIVKQTQDGKVLGSDGVKSGERNEVAVFNHIEPFGITLGSKIRVEFDAYVKSEYGTSLIGMASPNNTGAAFWNMLYFRFSHVDGMIDNVRVYQL